MRMPIAALTVLLATSAAADEVTEQLDLARQLYDEGDFSGAMTELEFAKQAIQARVGEQYLATLPEPLPGWTAEPAQQEAGMSFLGGGITVSRAYREEAGSGSIDAQLIVDNPMIQGFAAMLGNPAILAADPSMKRVRVGRDNALLKFEQGDRSGEITLVLGKAMIQLSGHDLSGPEPLESLLQAWDIATVKQLAAD